MILENIRVRLAVSAAISFVLFSAIPLSAAAFDPMDVWWPSSGAHMQGAQPFKAMVSGLDVSQYDMFWQVDGGKWNWMDTSYQDYQHKEADVDLSNWTWRGNGPYTVTFIARQGTDIIAQQSETIYVDGAASEHSAQSSQPLAAMHLFVDPHSSAALQATEWESSNPSGAQAMSLLASQPTAAWFGDWNTDITKDVHATVARAQALGASPVLVAYNIPERDCGGFSANGWNTLEGYASWVQAFAAGIGDAQAVVILEPDALAQINCLSGADQETRKQLLSNAIVVLKRNPHTAVYLDAGHAGWVDPSVMARTLLDANLAQADGFSLNVSNVDATPAEIQYGQEISAQTDGAHFVIDTSRNGSPATGGWCNPSGAAIGNKPTVQTGVLHLDAFLWVKVPGESDGECGGGPRAGQWWPQYALGLVENAR